MENGKLQDHSQKMMSICFVKNYDLFDKNLRMYQCYVSE